ncbi:hypothetical protein BELL_0441g00110 [Botrytis elliptica]|uniref:Uncharacterized protein n=1 Tax=Botrytis elliptica TaxID=278938 RepID=A0A4Z1JGV9_9HELO|nr:hypothetical protein BELL_0441g00110 [Botrytis elliptica]
MEGQCLLIFRINNDDNGHLGSNGEADSKIYLVAPTERQIARNYLVAPTERSKPICTSHLSSNQHDLEKAGEKLNESPRPSELRVFWCPRTVESRMNQKLHPLSNDTDLNCNRWLDVGGYGRRLSSDPEACKESKCRLKGLAGAPSHRAATMPKKNLTGLTEVPLGH